MIVWFSAHNNINRTYTTSEAKVIHSDTTNVYSRRVVRKIVWFDYNIVADVFAKDLFIKVFFG